MAQREVVIIKDYPARKITMGFMSAPLMFIFAAIFGIPLIFNGLINNLFIGLALTIVAELMVVAVGLWYTKNRENPQESTWIQKFRLNKFSWKWGGIAAAAGLGMTLLLQGVSWVIEKATGTALESSDTTVALTSDSGLMGIILMFVMVPFIVPIVEEVLFRGFILNSLEEGFKGKDVKRPIFWSVLVSSILFAIVHFQGFSTLTDWFLLLWITGVSVINALLVIKSNSLYTSIISHSVYNLSSVLLVLLIGT